jgi:hypothetical protein
MFMMNYEIGKQYEMKVVGIRMDSAGYKYIALHDDDPNKEYRVYNILKCQHDDLPETLYVTVKSIDSFGKVKFVQDEGRLNKEHYKQGKLYAFEVTDVKEDYKTKASFYVIEDDFTSHRYYFKGEQKFQIGDSCILEVECFTERGDLRFKEVEQPDSCQVEKVEQTKNDNTAERLASLWDSLPVLEVGDENQRLELKTSIVFTPGDGKPNIDKQLYNILKELAAFLNTDGGALYIGIHDSTKKVIGIAAEYDYLNDGKYDEYNGQYKKDNDGYELKIRNTMDRLFPSLANSLTKITFESMEGNVYCKIEVKPARRPIFLDGTKLFVRQGNRIKQLKGEEITMFIYDRMTISVKEVLDLDDLSLGNGNWNVDAMVKAMKEIINERKTIPVDLPKPKDLGEIDYWIIWYQDSSWKRSREKSLEEGVYIQVPVFKHMSDPILTFCYETGKVCTIKLTKFRSGTKLNTMQKKGWSRTGDKPKNIFIMHATDYLVGYSVDSNGIESVKLHAISDYTPKKSADNLGRAFLPDTSKIVTYAVLGAEHQKNVKHLIVTKKRRSSEVEPPYPALH